LTSLISKNFFGKDDYLEFYGGHVPYGMELSPTGKASFCRQKNFGCIYVKRNFEDVAKSIFKLRARFGLTVPDIETFQRKRYSEMWCPKQKVEVIRDNLQTVERFNTVSGVFRQVNMLPEEYHQYCIELWEKIDDVLIIDYDNLVSDLVGELNKVCQLLGLPARSEFAKIEKQVGWRVVE
jgi:hypothetical protein